MRGSPAAARRSFPRAVRMLRRLSIGGWLRAIALVPALVFCLISFGYAYAPSALVRPLYPLSYEEDIEAASEAYKIDPYLVAAIIECESNWDPRARSSHGAEGLMQLMPETAQDMVDKGYVDGTLFAADDLLDPETNIIFGCAYLRYLLDYYDGAQDRAIAAYNAGIGNVEDWVAADTSLHNAITFPETQAYLVRVLNAYNRYGELYAGRFADAS